MDGSDRYPTAGHSLTFVFVECFNVIIIYPVYKAGNKLTRKLLKHRHSETLSHKLLLSDLLVIVVLSDLRRPKDAMMCRNLRLRRSSQRDGMRFGIPDLRDL